MVKSVYGTFAAFLFSDTNTDKRLVQTTITELAVSGYYVVYRFNFAPLTHVFAGRQKRAGKRSSAGDENDV